MKHSPDWVWRVIPEARDVENVRRLVARTGVFSPAEISIAAELVADTLRCGAAAGYENVFVEASGQLAGYTCFGPIPATASSHDLYWIGVDPAWHGHGLGGRLLARSEQCILACGGRLIWVDTSSRPEYAPAHRMYEQAGSRQAARLEDFYAPGDSKLIYSKTMGQPLADRGSLERV
jgi:GNAT superfamily N-acetyltransferase